MHVFEFSFYCTALVYVFFYQFSLFYWFFAFVGLYILISMIYPKTQNLSVRRKLALANWNPPSDGLIYNRIPLKVDKLLKYIDTFPLDKRPTITHYVIKACGQVLKENPDLNGKLIFGKFLPYQTCDVSCLVNIDDGNDVGQMLIKDVPNKSVQEIGNLIRAKAQKLRPEGGDSQHKKRMALLKLLPSFLIGIIYKLSIFLTSHLGVNIPWMGLTKDLMGSMIVTSVGPFGYVDASTSFFGTTGQWILMTVNACHQQVIIENGIPVIANIVNINCTIDHRYLYSGGRGKNLVPIFNRVFENPQNYTETSQQKKNN